MGNQRIGMKIFITGGGGFLARHIIQQLLTDAHEVTAYQRGDYSFLKEWGVICIKGDLTDAKLLSESMQAHDVVFHVAAKAGVWGDYDEYYGANVVGTNNVLKACEENDIKYLVYTSTPSVVFNGEDEEGINESEPYANKTFNAYQDTKIIAEKAVLAANSDRFKTVCLRPHLIWGIGDPHIITRIVQRARANKLKLVKTVNKKMDACYVENAASAHIKAMNELLDDAKCAGNAYFISNDEPMPINELINKILHAANLQPAKKYVSAKLAFVLGGILETVYKVLRVKKEPLMTRYVAKQLSVSHWYDLSAAKNDFSYSADITTEQGMKKLAEYFATQK